MTKEQAKSIVAPDGGELSYRVQRSETSARTLVLIHGMASNLTRWSEFVSATRLARDWNLLRVDLRGHGGSRDWGRIGIDVWCEDLKRILAAEHIPRALIAGHCMGANVALWFAHRTPELVDGLVLVEPMLRVALYGTLGRASKFRQVLVPVISILRALSGLGVHRRRLQCLDLEALDREARDCMQRTGEFPVKRFASMREDLKCFPLIVYLQDLFAVTAETPELSSLSYPTLALVSSGGVLTDPEITARRLSRMPDCRIEKISAKHWIPTEQPEAMRRAIEEFCESIRPGSLDDVRKDDSG
jgi:pimeloyl-ACP methyl ester carboxylesterase